jgi:sugar lactone lactonase YvrE
MRLRKTATKNVNPAVAAVAIALTLGAVQYVWWTKLVARPKVRPGGGRMSGGQPGPHVPTAFGLKDVKVDTLAGTPEPGLADGPGHAARFDGPTGLAMDKDGAVVVADTRNSRIRLVSPIGHTSTLAGSTAGFQDGPATTAQFNAPSGVAVGPDGAVYVADTGNHRIRRILSGTVTTVAGGPSGMRDGPAATALFDGPAAIVIDTSIPGESALLIADSGNRRIRRLRLGSATVETVSTESSVPAGVGSGGGQTAEAFPEQGRLAIASRQVTKLPIDLGEDAGRFPKNALTVAHPAAVCPAGREWFVTDAVHAALMRVRSENAQVVAGFAVGSGPLRGYRDGMGDRAMFGILAGIVADGRGHVYVSDCSNNAIRRVTLPAEGLP